MPFRLLLVLLAPALGLALWLAFVTGCRSTPPPKPVYPAARTVAQVDDYHGTAVADPYRWLEELDSPETRKWIEDENRLTRSVLDRFPARRAIGKRLTELWDFERFGVPFQRGGRYFFQKNSGLQDQAILYVTNDLAKPARVLLDPNTLSSDGTVALGSTGVSEDGRLIAYSVSTSGSDWQEWKVRDVESGHDLSDHLLWSKFSGAAWTHDGKGFYYGRYDAPKAGEELKEANYFQKVYYHRIGTMQSEDTLVYERPDQKEWGFDTGVSEDGRYLVLHSWVGTDPKNRVFYLDLQDPAAHVVELLNEFDASYVFLGNDGPLFWFKTDLNAPRGRVVAIDTRDPARSAWKELIPENKDTLEQVQVVCNRFIGLYLKDARSVVRVFETSGTYVKDLALPGLGTVGGFDGRRADRETFYSYASYNTPSSIFRLNMESPESAPVFKPRLLFDPEDIRIEQIFYTSRDGTQCPMFLAHKRGLRKNGRNRVLLYGYGGFAIPQTPSFSVPYLTWMDRGGMLAVAGLRGGGEYGENWHQAGTKGNKQNVFDDFIAAAEWLVKEGYTVPSRLGIHGRSNGGLLIGACLAQRPELFGAAVPAVGVMDMLRFNKFTIGWAWTSDYGNPDLAADFPALRAYSPLHNLRPGTAYPPTLILTGDHDDRVFPAHSFKFAAALQAAQGGPAPVLIRIETRAGHGAGKPTSKQIDEWADVLTFLEEELR